jgi:hypothetical protein
VEHPPEGLRVVQRHHFDVQLLPASLFDQLHAIGDHRQGGQSQKVHFEQAHLFDRLHVVGSHDFVVLGPVQRHQLRQRSRRDHHR